MRFLKSVKSLYAAVGILFLTVGIGSYVDFQNEAMHARHLEINTGFERMVRLNQELTNMLLIAVLEQNALRAASYDTVNNNLSETIKTVANHTKTMNLHQEISSLGELHSKIHTIEENVIKLMGSDKFKEAKKILFGDEYVRTKKTYEIDTETAVSAVMGELSQVAQRFRRIRTGSLVLRISAFLLLLWVGIMFSRRTQADLKEQIRLRNEITVAYEGMEERVRERTADLEETTRQLALENEERLRSDARTRLILNSAGDGIFGLDKEERVTFFNTAAETLLGYKADEVIGKEIHSLILHSYGDGTAYPREQSPFYQACIRGQEKHVTDGVLWRKDGSSFPSEYAVTPISEDEEGTVGAVMVFRDITQRKSSEQELKQRMEDLERFNRLTMGREQRMIQLKGEINALLEEMGREKKYRVVDEEV
jgi:PAS domain S-box-containing protein